MKTQGLRISDIKDGKCIPLIEVLEEIPFPNEFHWSLLWCEVTPIKEEGEVIIQLQQKVNTSKDGLLFTFDLLVNFSKKIFQEIELLLIGSRVMDNLHRYEKDQEMQIKQQLFCKI